MPALPIWLWLVLGGAGVVVVTKALSPSKPKIMQLSPEGMAILKQLSKEAKLLASFGPQTVGADERFVMIEPSSLGIPRAISACQKYVGGFNLDQLNASLYSDSLLIPGFQRVDDKCVRLYGPALVQYDPSFKFGTYDKNGCPTSFSGTAIDIMGTSYWANTLKGDNTPSLCGSMTDVGYMALSDEPREENWGDTLNRVMTEYVLPAIAAFVTVYVPGGVFIAVAITAYAQIAKGSTITDVIVAAAEKQVASQFARSEFRSYYDQLSTNRYTAPAVDDLRAQVRARYKDDEDLQKHVVTAFNDAMVLGRGKRTQDIAIAEIKKRLDRPQAGAWLDKCLKKNVPLHDWIRTYAGTAGTDLLRRIMVLAGQYVESGEVGVFRPSPLASVPINPIVKPIGTYSPLRPYTIVRKF